MNADTTTNDLLQAILEEMRKFNRTIPLLDDLAKRNEYLAELRNEELLRRKSAASAWDQFESKRGPPTKHKKKSPESCHSPGSTVEPPVAPDIWCGVRRDRDNVPLGPQFEPWSKLEVVGEL